jgi:hypothetical protein
MRCAHVGWGVVMHAIVGGLGFCCLGGLGNADGCIAVHVAAHTIVLHQPRTALETLALLNARCGYRCCSNIISRLHRYRGWTDNMRVINGAWDFDLARVAQMNGGGRVVVTSAPDDTTNPPEMQKW